MKDRDARGLLAALILAVFGSSASAQLGGLSPLPLPLEASMGQGPVLDGKREPLLEGHQLRGAPVSATRGSSARGASARRSQPDVMRAAQQDVSVSGWVHWWEVQRPLMKPVRETSSTGSPESAALSLRGRRDVSAHDPLVRDEIVPALQAVLRREIDDRLLRHAVLALGAVADSSLAPFVRRDARALLDHPSHEVRAATLLTLGLVASVEEVGILTAVAYDMDDGRRDLGVPFVPMSLRAHAALALGLAGTYEAGEALVELLAVVPRNEVDLRGCAVAALALTPPDEDADLVVLNSMLSERETWPVQAIAAIVAARRGVAPALRHLREALADERLAAPLRAACAEALGRHPGAVDDAAARGALRQAALEDLHDSVRGAAWLGLVRVLDRRDDPDELAAIVQLLDRQISRPSHGAGGPWPALAAAWLGMRRPELAPGFAQAVADSHRRTHQALRRAGLALAVGLLGAREATAALVDDLENSHAARAGYSAAALGLLGASNVGKTLRNLVLDNGAAPVRRLQAGRALASLAGPTSGVRLLARLMREPDAEQAWILGRSLGELGDGETVMPLVRLVEDEELLSHVRGAACLALGHVAARSGGPRPWTMALLDGLPAFVDVPTLRALVEL